MKCVLQYGLDLKDVPVPARTPELCMTTVQQDGKALEHVPYRLRTAALCLEAVKKGACLEDVPKARRSKRLLKLAKAVADGDEGGEAGKA